jgi:hypothetical protein
VVADRRVMYWGKALAVAGAAAHRPPQWEQPRSVAAPGGRVCLALLRTSPPPPSHRHAWRLPGVIRQPQLAPCCFRS